MSQRILYAKYDKAQKRADSSNLFVVRLLAKIHQSMLENANVNFKPIHAFDMCYFYDALIKCVSDYYDCDVQNTQPVVSMVLAANPPVFTDSPWKEMHFVENGMANRLVDLIQRESKPDGIPFDLTFACGIAAAALDKQAVQFIREGIGKVFVTPVDDLDDWAGGFFAADES